MYTVRYTDLSGCNYYSYSYTVGFINVMGEPKTQRTEKTLSTCHTYYMYAQ